MAVLARIARTFGGEAAVSDKTKPPENWQRRQCPVCSLWVTGLINDAHPVAEHGCGAPWPPEIVALNARIEAGEDVFEGFD